MPLLVDDALAALLQDIRHGRVGLVVWGVLPHNDLFLWQCPLPVAYYVDDNPELWGGTCLNRPVRDPAALRDEEPGAVAVCLHRHLGPYLEQLGRHLDAIGPFRYFVPPRIGADPADLAGLLADWRRRSDRGSGVRGVAVLYLERLALGGAEGQLCHLAAGLADRGWSATMVLDRPVPPDAARYGRELDRHGVGCVVIGQPSATDWHARLMATLEPEAARLLRPLPPWLLPQILALIGFLRQVRPELAIGFLDRPNLILGVAAVLAGVPRVLLSGRNVDPTHFPHFFQGQTADFRVIYRALLALDGVWFSANAEVGARSYDAWLGRPEGQTPVIANAVATMTPPRRSARARAALRARWALPTEASLVLGVFRLEPEKQPTRFVEVLARLRTHRPEVHGVICGTGSLTARVQTRADELGVSEALSLLGAVDDIPALLAEATLLLHVSHFEGTPNVLLEAQSLGLPVVSTRTGGSEAILAPALRPYCREPDDSDGLAQACLALITDDALRRRLAPRLRRFIRRRHTVDRLVNETLAVVERFHIGERKE